MIDFYMVESLNHFMDYDDLLTKKMIEQINQITASDGLSFDFDTTEFTATSLPFYDEVLAVIVQSTQKGSDVSVSFLYDQRWDKLSVLDGSADSIYLFNKSYSVSLTHDTIAEYLKFYLAHVMASDGRFYLIQSVEDISWRDEPDPNGKLALGKMITPVAIKKAEDDFFILNSTVIFQDFLIEVDIKIDRHTGVIEFLDKDVLVKEIPVSDIYFYA